MPDERPTPGARRAATWRRYLRFWGPRVEADVDDELSFHVEMRVRDYAARGMSEAAARAAAARRLGDLDAVRAACVDAGTRRERRAEHARVADALVQDLRFAVRTLGRQKGWTAVAVLTLALGIGANTAVFSAVNSLLLHPLPYPDASRIALVYQEPSRGNNTGVQVTIRPQPTVVLAWRRYARSFEDLESFATEDRILQPARGTPQIVHVASVLPSFARFAGQHPLVGRFFGDADVGGGERVALLGEAAWRGRFAADPRVVGRTIDLDRVPYTIIGVAPAALRLPRLGKSPTDVWLPYDLAHAKSFATAIGRLRRGVTYAAAQHELDAIAGGVGSATGSRQSFATKLMPPSRLVGFRQSLLLLSGAVALVLLIACANVAHLLLARAATRQRELAIRAAIGAGRGRIFRQLLTESLVLAIAGCLGGIAVGWAGLRAMVALRPAGLAELSAVHQDAATLAVAIGLSLATGVAFGLAGALPSTRASTHDALKAGAPSTSHSRRHGRLRSLLVVSEIALSTTLLVGAALLVRSVRHLQSTDPGFDPTGLYAVSVTLPDGAYATPAARTRFYETLASRAGHLPGVEGVTVAVGAPPSSSFIIGELQVEGQAPPPAGATSFINFGGVAPDYFRVLRIPIVQGTTFTDTSAAAGQVLVNEGFARKYWPGASALGRRLRVVYQGQGDWKTVVGVVGDASTGGLESRGADPTFYAPGSEAFLPVVIVRASARANPMTAVRALVASLDPHLPPPEITSVEQAMRDSIAGVRFTMLLLTVFTVLAVVLAAIGLYGVMAYGVAQRTREIGIRIALGATRRDIGRSIVTEGVLLASAGIAVGLLGAHWATRLVDTMLYGVARTDAVSFGAGAVLLLATAVAACVVPMRRAFAVDPLIAMRAE